MATTHGDKAIHSMKLRAISRKSRAKAMRAMCVECMGGATGEVEGCTATKCALFPYRLSGSYVEAEAERHIKALKA